MATEQPCLPLQFLRVVQCSAAHMDDPNHHLRWKRTGYWQLRIILPQAGPILGKRFIIGLKTRCVETARARRDSIINAMIEKGQIPPLSPSIHPKP